MNELIQIQKIDGVEMMVNINGNYERRTCYFEVVFSIGDACGNQKLCGHRVIFSGNLQKKTKRM